MPNPIVSEQQAIEVTQEDREAAAGFYGPHLARPGEVLVTAHMQAGKVDDSPLVQAFARHRIQALEKTFREAREASEIWENGNVG